MGIDGLLQAEAAAGKVMLEAVLRNAVEERNLLDDLVDGSLNGREFGGRRHVGLGGAEVKGDDGDAVGEVLEVLAGTGQTVVVVEVRKGAEHSHGRSLRVGDDQTLFTAALDLEHFDDGAGAADGIVDDILVDGLGVGGSLLQETLLTDDFDVGLLGIRVGVGKLALVDEVATELLLVIAGERRGRAEGLDPVAVVVGGVIDVFLIDALFVAGAIDGSHAGPAGIDVDGVILGLLVQTNFDLVVITGEGGDLGGVEGEDVRNDGIDGLGLEVGVIDTQHVVEPIGFGDDKITGEEAFFLEEIHDYTQVS